MLRKLTKEQQDTILERAIEEFGDKGLAGAAIGEIAKRSGISVGVIYKYYANKEALFDHCLRHSIEVLSHVMDEAVNGQDTLSGSLEKLIRACVTFTRNHASYIRMYHAITMDSSDDGAAGYAGMIETITAQTYTDILERAREEGKVREDLDPGIAAMLFDNLLMMLHFSCGCRYYEERRRIYDEKEDDERLISQMLSFIRGGLGLAEERGV